MDYALLKSLFLTLFVINSLCQYVKGDKIPIGVIFDQNTEEIQNAFKLAMIQHSNPNTTRLDVQLNVDLINTADAFKLSRLICNQFARSVVAMLGSVTADAFDTLHSYANTFQMPFVTPWFPEKVIPPSSGLRDYAISLRPDYHKAVIDTINYYGWKNIIYIYDSHDGLLRLQQLYLSLRPGKATFRISNVKRVANASDVVHFLRALEKLDRWTHKYVILDSTTKLAKETLISHVRDVQLGRRNYHYFLTGLVMDDRWEREVLEFGAVNITGFRLLDPSKKTVQHFIELWKSNAISARAALTYDAVHLLVDTIIRLFRKKPDALRTVPRRNSDQNISKPMDCNPPAQSHIIPYEHGEKISRMIKRTEIEGLTGAIRFNEAGHRKNFTLQVMEMTVDRDMVKIATWYDYKGFIPVNSKMALTSDRGLYDRNKTYIISTIVEPPYVMKQKSENFGPTQEYLQGFCVDLANLITEKLEIEYEMRLVKDNKYGAENPKIVGGWDGLIGEVLRKEADIVIAPLTVTLEREAVVDFSKPFLSFDMKPNRNNVLNSTTIFMFFNPLSKEIWVCIIFCFVAVSAVLFLVSRFSPKEWRLVSFSESQTSEHNELENNQTMIINEFSFWNSLWYSIGSFMQQGSDITPRSISGRIVSSVWWFFTLIVVSMYTANFASYLTLARIYEPTLTYNKIVSCPEDSTVGLRMETVQDEGWLVYLLEKHQAPNEKVHRNPCEMLLSVANSGVKEFAVALPKGSVLRDGINLAIQALRNEGELQRLVRKWFVKTECDVPEQRVQNAELTLGQIAGLFYVLLGGLALALAVALFEYCQYGRAEAARANVSLRDALKAKTALTNDTDRKPLPPRNRQRDLDRAGCNRGAYTGYYTSASQIGQEETTMTAGFAQV